MTMTNAEWCIKNGIQFKNLKCECYLHSSQDSIGCYDSDGIYREFYKGKAIGDTMTESILSWLDMEHVEPILDDAEKRYLKGVIRPFRESVRSIAKSDIYKDEAICIDTEKRYMVFPPFKAGTMYKGMELNRKYTLEELGL